MEQLNTNKQLKNYNNLTEGYWPENDPQVTSVMINFLDTNWKLSWYSSLVYLIVIYIGRQLMRERQKLGLSYTLALWSGSLAIFSMMGAYRLVANIYHSIVYDSFEASVCKHDWTDVTVIQFWTSLFSLSKIVELGDTVFIVLRKTPLIFLHYYHHVTVLVYTWYSYPSRTSSGRWYIAMNYAVHSVMYTYYALAALKIRSPKWVRMGITISQLSQMVVGVYINLYGYAVKKAGSTCGITDDDILYSLLMYASYFLLFLKFFYEAYFSARKSQSKVEGKNGHNIMNGAANGHTNGHANGNMSNGAGNKHLKKHE